MDPRTPKDPIEQIAARFDALKKKVDELATPSGSAANRTVEKLTALVDDIQRQLDDYIANGTYNKEQIDAGFATKAHRHPADDIDAGTVTGPLGVNGDVTGKRGVFPTGVRSTGARANQVTTDYVVAYIDGAGNLGFAPSTKASKNDHGLYAVDMAKFLAVELHEWSYKNDPKGRRGMGPFAEDLDAAGLNELVLYSPEGEIQGVRIESLVVGLWSAYVQSRTTTLARIGRMRFQTRTVTGMTTLGLNAEKTYDIVWPEEFADADYLTTASVSSSGLALAAVASIVPGSRTAKGCRVSVRTLGLALASGATLTVEAIHI